MTAEYNLPLHVTSQNGDDYVIENGYPHDGVTPPGMGWDEQGDGGGKFRLKRRRRCGQCAPCQVKENCNKCQYCMRKDVLKQACIYRKCVYLRKPVPRFRQEPPVGTMHKSAPTPPRKPISTQAPTAVTNSNNGGGAATQNANNNTTTSAPASALSSPASVPSVSSSHQSELSSCRLNQSPFAALSAMNNSVLDPLRHRMMEHQHRSSLFETMGHHHPVLDPSKSSIGDMSRYPAGPGASCLSSSHCKLDQRAASMNHSSDMNLAAAAAAAVSPLNSVTSHHSHHQANKALPTRDPYFSSMESWNPYALPRPHTWAPTALPNHHAAAAAYGFQQHSTPFPSSFAPSSCRLGLPDSTASRYGSPQHSFHHSMAGFSQDLTHATVNHANHATMRSPMNTPFYSANPHISPSSIPTFTGLGQFSPNQASFGPAAYPMHPHAHMYPGGFYSTFRAATEPQIYHAQIFPSQNPFKHIISSLPVLTNVSNDKGEKLNDKLLNLDIFSGAKDNLLRKDFNSSIAHDSDIYEECIEKVWEHVPMDSNNECSKNLNKNFKAPSPEGNKAIPVYPKDKYYSNKTTQKVFLQCNTIKKGIQQLSFQKSVNVQDIFDRLDQLSYFPECGCTDDLTSMSHRPSDGDMDSDSGHDAFDNKFDACKSQLTNSNPSSLLCSEDSSDVKPFFHAALSSPKVWPSYTSDQSTDQPSDSRSFRFYRKLKRQNMKKKKLKQSQRIKKKYSFIYKRIVILSKNRKRKTFFFQNVYKVLKIDNQSFFYIKKKTSER